MVSRTADGSASTSRHVTKATTPVFVPTWHVVARYSNVCIGIVEASVEVDTGLVNE